ncbi:MAG: hypothetical protein ABWZ76_04210 [Acidimicrobiales bacterium]
MLGEAALEGEQGVGAEEDVAGQSGLVGEQPADELRARAISSCSASATTWTS